MSLSLQAQQELRALADSAAFRDEMRTIARTTRTIASTVSAPDMDAYLEFVTQCNELAGHAPKPVRRIVEDDMRL